MIVNIDKCKSYLNINHNDDDNFIKDLINYSQSIIESYCKRRFEEQEYTEELHVIKNTIFTNNYPIVEVIKLDINGSEINNQSYKILNSYVTLSNKTTTLNSDFMYNGNPDKTALITYVAGYDAVNIPMDIKFACIKLVAYYYKEAREDRLGIKSEKIDVMSTAFIEDIPIDIINTISRYRKVNV